MSRMNRLGLPIAVAVPVLLPVGRMAELPMVLALLAGLVLLVRPAVWRDFTGSRLVLAAFLAYAGAAWLSVIDAHAPQASVRAALGYLRFLPAALWLAFALSRRTQSLPRAEAGVAAIVLLWALDALVQAATGWSLGGRLEADRVSGVFGDEDLKLGPALAVLSPFALAQAGLRAGRTGLVASWLLIAAALLVAGARAAWVMYGLVTLVVILREWRGAGARAAAIAVALLLAGGGIVVGSLLSDRVAARVDRSLAALRGDAVAIDHASAFRLPIWSASLSMIATHPVNGVGVRGFRHAYPEHAPEGDRFVDEARGTGALHAHQLVLEVASETGLLGLIAWFAAAFLVTRAWWRAAPAARARAAVPGLALGAMLFPLNTHFAFYSAYWGLLAWWLFAIFVAALEPEARAA